MDTRGWTDGDLKRAVVESKTYIEAVQKLGLKPWPGNVMTMKGHIHRMGLSTAHFDSCPGGTKAFPNKEPLQKYLVEESFCNRNHLKQRLIKEQVLIEQCAICHCDPTWMGRPLSLVLDHINGRPTDNRLENLRLLCPNCNSQTETFSGRNKRKRYFCKTCSSSITRYSKTGLCMDCLGRNARKVSRPSLSDLETSVSDNGYVATGKKYGVTDNTIRKWIKQAKRIIPSGL